MMYSKRTKLMTTRTLEVYEILKGIGLEEEKARKLVDYIEESAQTRIERELHNFATKEDLVRETEKLRLEMANLKSDLIKWMFIFWVGQVAVISGIVFAMLELYFK